MSDIKTANRPADIILPEGWTWERVEAERAKWGIDDDMVPVASIPGACVAWGTINSVRIPVDDWDDPYRRLRASQRFCQTD